MDNKTIIKNFAQAANDTTMRCGNVWFEGDKFYSYSTMVACKNVETKQALVTSRKYSVTTTRHCNMLAFELEQAGYTVTRTDRI